MSTILEYDLRDTIDIERKLLLFCGLYPKDGRVKNTFLYYLSACYHIGMSVLLHFSMVILIHKNSTNVTIIADALPLFMTETAFLCKILNLMIQRRQILTIETLLSHPAFYSQSSTNLEIIKKTVNFTKFVGITFRAFCGMVCGVVLIFPLFDNDLENVRPVLGWYPWGPEERLKFTINFIFHLMAFCLGAYLSSGIDLLPCMLINLASSLLEALKNNLYGIRYDAEDAKYIFAKNIELHNAILRLVDLIESTFSYGIFIQFLSSVVVICCTGFQVMIVPPKSLQFICIVLYFLCMFGQVTMYCWFGHNVISSSETLGQAVYMSNWHDADPILKKSIFIFMEKCKRPVVFTAGKYFPLSLMTLTSILRASYSYFTILRRLYFK